MFGGVESMVGKKEKMLLTNVFSCSTMFFKNTSSLGSLKAWIVWLRVKIKLLLDDKLLTFSKIKVFADDNFDEAQMVQFFFDRLENIVG